VDTQGENITIQQVDSAAIEPLRTLAQKLAPSQFAGERLEAELSLKHSFFFTAAATCPTKPCGFVHAWYIASVAEIHFIATAPEFRQKGVASKLLHALFAHARSQGCNRVELEVEQRNPAAIALYKKKGFICDGYRKNYYGQGIAALLMSRPL